MPFISKFKTLFLTFITLTLTLTLIIFPKAALSASLRGLDLWWEVVFPSLLPFFITAELLIGFGVVHGLGVLSERFMRPLFNVPGCGGFVWMMGMASGYPAGAKWTVDLRIKGQVTKAEAERLVAFTNASSPLFIFGAVSVGFFHDATLGLGIAFAHYGASMVVGIMMRFYKRKENTRNFYPSATLKQLFTKIHLARIEDGRTIGKLMGDAVTRSVDTLLMVGGFIMLFSVLTELLKQTGATYLLSHIFTNFGVPESFHLPVIAGMLEMTTGIGSITNTNESLLTQLMFVSFLLGFHGFSIQAQIASIIAESDISFKPYALARLAHGSLAALFTFVYFGYYEGWLSPSHSLPIWNPQENFSTPILDFFQHYGPQVTIIMIMLMIIVKFIRINKKITTTKNIS